MKKCDVECCCVARNTKKFVIEPASRYYIEGGGGNCVLVYSKKYSHNLKKQLIKVRKYSQWITCLN